MNPVYTKQNKTVLKIFSSKSSWSEEGRAQINPEVTDTKAACCNGHQESTLQSNHVNSLLSIPHLTICLTVHEWVTVMCKQTLSLVSGRLLNKVKLQ